MVGDVINRQGPLRFDEFLELALYGPDGFYARGRGAGRRGDFLTSPEVGPLFGAVVARALDVEWRGQGQPDPFVVVEAGAGRGQLARSLLDANPACAGSLRYVCVERSPTLRAAATAVLHPEPATMLLGPVVGADEELRVLPGRGPLVAVVEELPATVGVHAVLANELLDNLPFRLLQRHEHGWGEVFVGMNADGALGELLVDAAPGVAAEADRLAPDAPSGARIPLQHAAVTWLRRALALVVRGRVVVIDYADTTAGLALRPWHHWTRTYRAHGRGGAPLDTPGSQDVTCEVAVDQLAAAVGRPDADRSQAEWLASHGIDELVAAARSTWHERAHLGDLAALAARSRVGEAEALCDPGGLGAFRVLEWLLPRGGGGAAGISAGVGHQDRSGAEGDR
ncbi:MAG: SAM-dependent methyltransferase [Actinomycetota bacterium]|nr:SAM-dependent methyltransferase [Actinomycetota bacterium]